jgi:hypothetical protein
MMLGTKIILYIFAVNVSVWDKWLEVNVYGTDFVVVLYRSEQILANNGTRFFRHLETLYPVIRKTKKEYALFIHWSTRLCSWLRHYATSQKVTGSIPDEVTLFFNWSNPSSHTMALGSTQSVTEMSTRNIRGGKGHLACKVDNLTTICEPNV